MGSGGSEPYVHMLVNEEERVIFLKVQYLFLWIFQGFCKEFNLIHPFDSALCFVNIRCARRGVPPLAARPSPEKFFITVSMLGNIVLCIQHLSL